VPVAVIFNNLSVGIITKNDLTLYMTQYFKIHPDTPQERLIGSAAVILGEGGVVIYPTDSCYALGCCIGEKEADERIRQLRRLDPKHNMTLVCRDLSEIANYAKVGNAAYRLMKSLTPGPYTFLLRAKRDVPRRLQHPRRKTIGLRVPDNRIALSLLNSLGGVMMSTSLILPGEDIPLTDPEEFNQLLENEVDLIIDGGPCGIEPTTVIDLADGDPDIVRQGKGRIHL
jgi:tRNA threonylcarbamoyl adenosine modification protein (Sua5/YciO/YrdC/YwlC family)